MPPCHCEERQRRSNLISPASQREQRGGNSICWTSNFLRENTELVRRKMLERGQDIDFAPFVNSEKRRRDILQEVEALRGERNKASKEIGGLKKEKKDASELVAKMATISDRIKALDAELAQADADIQNFVMVIPNVQHDSVEYGTSSEDNPVVRHWGEKPVIRLRAQAPLGHRRESEDPGLCLRGEDHRGALHPVSRLGRQARAGPHQLHARSAHLPAHLPGGPHPLHGQQGEHDRHGAAPEVR